MNQDDIDLSLILEKELSVITIALQGYSKSLLFISKNLLLHFNLNKDLKSTFINKDSFYIELHNVEMSRRKNNL